MNYWRSTGHFTPFNLSFSGDRYIKVQKTGYLSDSVLITSQYKDRTICFMLKPLPMEITEDTIVQKPIEKQETRYGYIKLTSNEQNVDIYIDNELIGQIQTEVYAKKVTIGKHQITAKKQFFQPVSISVTINENDVFAYNFVLVKAKGWIEDKPGSSQVRQAVGNLTVLTEHTDFRVYIEGVEIVPPFQFKDVPAGNYDIRIKRKTLDKTKSITINDGQTVIIDLDKEFLEK